MGLRFDTYEISEYQRTAQGGIRVPATLTRTGVFLYRNPDGTARREYRPADEVFSPRVLDAIKGSPVTNDHPYADGGRVDSANFKRLSVGHVGDDVRQDTDGKRIAATVYVQDADTVAAVEKGDLREISLGYRVDYDPTPGVTPEGEPYDGVQRNIRVNHTALVSRGRAGRDVGLRLDKDGDQVPAGDRSVKIKIGGKEYEAGSPEAEAAIAELQTRADSLAAENEKHRKAASLAWREKIKGAIKDVRTVLIDPRGVEVRADADDGSVMVDALKKICPGVPVDGMSPDYVSGAFAVALDFLMRQAAQAMAPDDDGDPEDVAEAEGSPGTTQASNARADRAAREDAEGDDRADADLAPDVAARQKMIKRGASLGKKD